MLNFQDATKEEMNGLAVLATFAGERLEKRKSIPEGFTLRDLQDALNVMREIAALNAVREISEVGKSQAEPEPKPDPKKKKAS